MLEFKTRDHEKDMNNIISQSERLIRPSQINERSNGHGHYIEVVDQVLFRYVYIYRHILIPPWNVQIYTIHKKLVVHEEEGNNS